MTVHRPGSSAAVSAGGRADADGENNARGLGAEWLKSTKYTKSTPAAPIATTAAAAAMSQRARLHPASLTAGSKGSRGSVPVMRLSMNPMNDDTQQGVTPVLDVVIPVHDEERDLEPSVCVLHDHLAAHVPFPSRITIVDNASTDATPELGARLSAALDGVQFLRIEEKGRGRALRTAWLASDAAVVAYMDVDLSTDLEALRPLIDPLIAGDADITIGSRLVRGAKVTRGLRRECISRSYNLLLRAVLHTRFHDAQCGFKALRGDVARALVPMVRDQGWFFDTELLVVAERAGMRIHEVPVTWIEDPDSRVDVPSTVIHDLRGVLRMRRGTAADQGGRRSLPAPSPELR